jgi:hypothetical protein
MPEELIEDIIAATKPEDLNIDPGVVDVKEPEMGREAAPADSQDDVKVEDKVEDQPEADASEAGDSIEAIAEQLGWRKDHTGEDAVDAKTYILRSREIQDTMRDHNKDLKNQLGTIQGSVEALKQHNERVYKAELKRMEQEIADLRKEKREAVELADVDKVDEIDQKIEDIQKDIREDEGKAEEASANPVYDEWIQENDWYLKDPEMAKYADTVAQQYVGAPLERIYPLVRQRVAEIWPEKFAKPADEVKPEPKKVEEPKKPDAPASPVEAASNKGGTVPTFTEADLTQEQRSIMNQFVGSGIMTKEQYIADIAKLQEG